MVKSMFVARYLEELLSLLGEYPLPFHPAPKFALVQRPSPDRTDTVQHLLLAVGIVLLEPAFKQRRDCVGKAKHHIRGALHPNGRRRFKYRGNLVISDTGDDRCSKHARGYPRLR